MWESLDESLTYWPQSRLGEDSSLNQCSSLVRACLACGSWEWGGEECLQSRYPALAWDFRMTGMILTFSRGVFISKELKDFS